MSFADILADIKMIKPDPTSSLSDAFEKLVHRICKLVSDKDSEVNWNEKIIDPDNPDQMRQIDISIRADRKLTIVECRIHKRIQDVKWIEELIGRRISLNADAVIAVSNSGFSEGARLKATRYGIILRDFLTLSDHEIQNWGKSTRFWCTYIQFSNLELEFFLRTMGNSLPPVEAIKKPIYKYGIVDEILRRVSNDYSDGSSNGNEMRFSGRLTPEGLDAEVGGFSIMAVEFKGSARSVVIEQSSPSVVAYGAPDVSATKREVYVEISNPAGFEFAHSSNRIYLTIDLSSMISPGNSKFCNVSFDFGRAVCVERMEIIGLAESVFILDDVKIALNSCF